MGKSPLLSSLALFGACLFLSTPALAVGIDQLNLVPQGVTADGTVVYGRGASGPTLYNFDGTYQSLPGAVAGGEVCDISGDGKIVGWQHNAVSGLDEAYYWASSSAAPVEMLPHGTYGHFSYATSISVDGLFATGFYSKTTGPWNQPFVYNTTTSALTLLTPFGVSGFGQGISNNGSIVVGYDFNNGTNITSASYWYNGGSGTNYTETLLSNATFNAVAMGINPTGTAIVGKLGISAGSNVQTAAKWTTTTPGSNYTSTQLGTLGGASSVANALNADGSVIVGEADTASGQAGFRWTSATGMISVEDWLTASGVTNSLGSVHTIGATGVSNDGSTVVGDLSNGDGYIARGSGLITINDLASSIQNNTFVPHAITQSADIVMHGAHGHPLLHLAPEDKSAVWLNGDFGGRSSRDSAAYTDIAEFGVGHRFGKDVQANVSIGKVFSGQNTLFNGNYKQDLTYVLPEVLANIPRTPIWTTVSAEYATGNVDIHRGYDNTGNQDYSYGSTNANLYAMRARLDWKDALTYGNATLTPFVDHEHTESTVNSYTENGGGFPIAWGSRDGHDDISRLGIDATKQVNDTTALHLTVEQNRWWQGQSSSATGEVLGLSTFNLPGETFSRDWTQFAVGVTHDTGKGLITAFVNATTNGQNPQFWGALGYQYNF